MTDSHYINRLVDWIVKRESSETAAALITADLEYLGRRLDAVDEAGHKGAHAEVDRFDASRFLVATYLVLGDVLRLDEVAPQAFGAPNIGDSVEVANDFLVVTDHRVAEVSSQDEV